MERGVQIGADVPYCIMRGTALAEGIGEALSPLPPMVKCPVLIAKPSISVSTKFVYQNLKLDDTTIHPDIDLLIDDIKAKSLHDEDTAKKAYKAMRSSHLARQMYLTSVYNNRK